MKEPCEITLSESSQSSVLIPPTIEKEVHTTKRTFASRKSLTFDNKGVDFNSSKYETATKDAAATLEKNESQSRHKKEYLEKLKIERENWKKLFEIRRKELKLARKIRSPVLDWDSCADFLSDEDKQFLKNKPDYNRIMLKQQQLQVMNAIYAQNKQKTAHINNSLLTFVEEELAVKRQEVFKQLNSHCEIES